jgi:hypothetical protein
MPLAVISNKPEKVFLIDKCTKKFYNSRRNNQMEFNITKWNSM